MNEGGGRGLDLFVVYRGTRDYPGKIVVRRQHAGALGVHADAAPMIVVADSDANLEIVRRRMIEHGLAKLDRHPNDDPVIVEVWL